MPKIATAQAATNEDADELFFPGPKVAARYDVSDMTLYRWLRDERMQFPKPTYLGRNRYWKLSDLVSWEINRAAGRPCSDAGSR
jgi:predicted DNA-binding transcriptional regulator AlpA